MKPSTVEILKQAVKDQIVKGKSVKTFTISDLDDVFALEYDGNIIWYIINESGVNEYQLTEFGYTKIKDELAGTK